MANNPRIVPAAQDTAERYWGGSPPFSFKGYAAVIDDEPVGVGGVYRAYGRVWAFSEFKDELRPFKKLRARAVRMLVSLMDAQPAPVFAIASPREETAGPLLRKLGFEPTGDFFEGAEILVRRKR